MAFKKVGIVPDGGAVFFLTQHLGLARAKELVYTARVVPASEALALGLVARVVPDDRLETEARALATELAESATYALALAKKMFHSMYVPTLEQLMELETLATGAARLTHDHKEGVDAFKEKRSPRFLGK
jgi:2-(1,2-epoxy-1,2-dihydrophenyl)acetyl-CoA isomerase